MKIRELIQNLYESTTPSGGKMVRGMMVWSPEEFLKSNGIKPGKNLEQDLGEDEQALRFVPKSDVQTKFSQQSIPDSDEENAAKKDERDRYSTVISTQELAQLAHGRNSYTIYYTDNRGIERNINRIPIYIDQATIEKVKQEAVDYVNLKFPEKTTKQKKSKAYTMAESELLKMAVEKGLEVSPEVHAVIEKGYTKPNKLKAKLSITKGERLYKPSIHKSSVPILDDNGKVIYDLGGLAERLSIRPTSLLVENEKMRKSNGKNVIMRNFGIPAITGLVIDEKTKEFRIVRTCPHAGKCINYCYATKGGYIQYKDTSEKQMRNLNFWYNDPNGFKNQIINELRGLLNPNKKVYLRWHDSGDFFDPAYKNLVYDIARAVPEATVYAYTKSAEVALEKNAPENFVINFSVGASSKEYKKINQHLGKDEKEDGYKFIKHSEVVPTELFKDEKTTGIGLDRLQAQDPQAQKRLKEVLAKTYNLNINRILTYQEMLQIPEKSTKPIYNVIIVPSLDGDLAAARRDVLGSYLLIH